MGELMAQFNAERAATGKAPVELGIGIASGEVVAGYTGTPQRTAYVCVGAAVERAARLEALAGGAAGAVLIDGATRAALAGGVPTETGAAGRAAGQPDRGAGACAEAGGLRRRRRVTPHLAIRAPAVAASRHSDARRRRPVGALQLGDQHAALRLGDREHRVEQRQGDGDGGDGGDQAGGAGEVVHGGLRVGGDIDALSMALLSGRTP